MTVETEVKGSQRVQMKGVFPRLVRWACCVTTRYFFSVLVALVGPEQVFFPHRTLFQLFCHHRPESWAGSRAGSPVSEYVSVRHVTGNDKDYLRKIPRVVW